VFVSALRESSHPDWRINGIVRLGSSIYDEGEIPHSKSDQKLITIIALMMGSSKGRLDYILEGSRKKKDGDQ